MFRWGKGGENLQYLGLDKEFLDLTPKAQSVKGKIDELHLIKIKNWLHIRPCLKGEKKQRTGRKYLQTAYLTED